MDEFAMGSSTENSAYQVTRNPWDLERIPGGSSRRLGGGGRGRRGAARRSAPTPAARSASRPALCGIVGLKPTYGRVSRYGLIAFASSLDQIGPFAHDVADAALLLEVIAGHDPRDSTSVDRAGAGVHADASNEPLKPLTIGVPREYLRRGARRRGRAAVRAALKVYEKLGRDDQGSLAAAQPVRASRPITSSRTAEASSNLARYDGVHYGHRTERARPT